LHSSFGANAKTYNGGFAAANFNGQRKSLEIGSDAQTAQFWEYNGDVGRRWNLDPLAAKLPHTSPYAVVEGNPIDKIDRDGQEPIKPLVGTVATFINIFNNTPSKIGLTQGSHASEALLRLGSTEFNWKQLRPLPTTTPYFNNRDARYIYTEKGGWIDMVHFLFYAGRAYDYKLKKADAAEKLKNVDIRFQGEIADLSKTANLDPVGEAVQEGYHQEMSDRFAAKYSAYSYEDLPTDKLAAEFGANYFNPKSKLTLGEQLQNYLNNNLKATDPKNAPNYSTLPTEEPKDKPSRTNHTTKPVYTTTNP
jgi:hypothetical protein